MYFTIVGSTKTGKELIRKATKEVGKRTSFLPKTIKYSVTEMEEQLRVLGKVLEYESRSSVKLILTLHDTEGEIEKAGTEYVFGPLNYQISEGFYPTLMDLVRLDVFKETDEAMSVEESCRNEKLLQALEEELESDQRKVTQASEAEVNKEAPWERPIFPKKKSKEKGEDSVDEKTDIPNQKMIFEKENEVMDQLEVDSSEGTMEDEETSEVEVDPVEANEEPTWTEEDPQEYIEPLISEEVGKNGTEIQKAAVFDYILD